MEQVVNDIIKSPRFAKILERLTFWIERAFVVFLIYGVLPNVRSRFLFETIAIFVILSNSLYLISFFLSLPQMANDHNDANAAEVSILLASGAVFIALAIGSGVGVAIAEFARYGSPIAATFSAMAILVTAIGVASIAKVEERLKNKVGKEEVQATDEMKDKMDKEFTGQQKTKLDVFLKESMEEEVRSSCCCSDNEECQSLETEYDDKYESLLKKYMDKCDGWEKERSQLMDELGASRASTEFYKGLLHDSP